MINVLYAASGPSQAEQEEAAVKIQSARRGNLARQQTADMVAAAPGGGGGGGDGGGGSGDADGGGGNTSSSARGGGGGGLFNCSPIKCLPRAPQQLS